MGAVLFVLYINDIDDIVNSKLLKLADYTKIYNRVDSVEGIERMRADLRNLFVWSKEWHIIIIIMEKTEAGLKGLYIRGIKTI